MAVARSIDWQRIRPLRGQQQAAFEELCCQLARREDIPKRVDFFRKGTPDSGVECFWVCSDQSEVAWQAKFFTSRPTARQWQQVDDSFEEALQGHPNLTHYIVCIPIDRPDAREPGKTSMLDQWKDRCRKWGKRAARRKRKISFEFWGSSELFDRLSRPISAGLFHFWFDTDELSEEWFTRHVNDQIRNAGPRYTKAINVEVPIISRINWILRTPKAIKLLHAQAAETVKELRALASSVQRQLPGTCEADLGRSADALTKLVMTTPPDPADGLRLNEIVSETESVSNVVGEFTQRARTHEKAASWKDQRVSYDRYAGHPFKDLLYQADRTTGKIRSLNYLAASDEAQLAEKPFLLITGKAGSGKTHLLCDAAERQVQSGLPAVLLLGERFNGTDEPWRQIIQMLGLDCSSGEELLELLDAAAEASGSRLLFLLDALNEGPGVSFWKRHLPGLQAAFERHHRIAFVITVRDPYAFVLFGDDIYGWPSHVSHDGFADVLEQACERFFSHYGLDAPSVPTLQAEFENPLFLTLFCKAIQNSGLRQVPVGVNGISLLLDFFLRSLRPKLFGANYVLDDPTGEKAQSIVNAVAKGLKQSPLVTEAEALESIKFASPTFDANGLLRTLLEEGVLRRTARFEHRTKTLQDGIDFGYERLMHHLIARSLLGVPRSQRGRLSKKHAEGVRRFYKANREDVSRLEALQVELSERFGQELRSVLRREKWTGAADRAFVQSLASRSPAAVTPHALDVISKALVRDKATFQRLVPLLMDVSYRPGHPLNASFLHSVLWKMSIAERDEWWTTFIHDEFDWKRGVSPDRIIRWLWRSDSAESISDESADLSATTVAWFFTSSNRFLRDRATKALVRVLSSRLFVAGALVARFAAVNDLYVLERVLAATYGAVLRSSDSTAIRSVAQVVLAVVLKPPVIPHAVIRHYSACIVELAVAQHGLSGVELGSLIAPLGSTWSEPPPMGALEPLFDGKEPTLGKGAHTILFSVDHHGDFGHYSMRVSAWTAVPHSEEEPPRTRKEAIPVVMEFANSLTKPQQAALSKYVSTAKAWASGAGNYDAVKLTLESATKTLRGKRRHVFSSRVAPLISELVRSRDEVRYPEFPKDLLQRFVLNWVAKSGWTSDRFGDFDSRVRGHGREEHKAERIGKKYQWIAYHEALARISDNFWMQTGESYREWSLDLRDIDPALLLWAMPTNDGDRPSFTWWNPHPGIDLALDESVNKWIESTSDLPDPVSLIAVQKPKSGERFFVLNAHNDIGERPEFGRDYDDKLLRRIWWFVDCFLVRKQDWRAVRKWGVRRKADYFNRETGDSFYEPSIAEYPRAPIFRDPQSYYSKRHEWQRENDAHEFLLSSDSYSSSDMGLDCSIESQINIILPAPRIIELLKLNHPLKDGDWCDASGNLVCTDPASRVPGENALIIDAEAFQRALDAEDLVPYWLIRGEKLTLGGREQDWPGHHLYHYFCWLENGRFRHRLSTKLNNRKAQQRQRRAQAT